MNPAHPIRGSGLPLPGFAALVALGVAMGGVGPLGAEALAYRHEGSRIHYQEYSQAAFDKARMKGQSDGALAWKILTGRGPMPSWAPVLDEAQIWNLVNYLRSLSR